jgi:hypothetical protein
MPSHPQPSMRNQISVHPPANAVPAVLAFMVMHIRTRLLSVDAHGKYSLAFTSAVLAQVTIFLSVYFAAIRGFPAAERAGGTASFLRTLCVRAAGHCRAVCPGRASPPCSRPPPSCRSSF